eukprot:CAMPEP_0172910176 /NCGR_PEP_ID=MMETSP1075-20121228/184137_1 /TAXON_ID=2916 /ORGANISM="Ceratium fusus, Strain PA161109" /LENGTH=94 /DNA_ID=CAMNT_0013768255 /DNA_START=107 /DNA_END=388 /DNA_ORIENTATION=+
MLLLLPLPLPSGTSFIAKCTAHEQKKKAALMAGISAGIAAARIPPVAKLSFSAGGGSIAGLAHGAAFTKVPTDHHCKSGEFCGAESLLILAGRE